MVQIIMSINLFEPCFGEEEIEAVSKVLRSKWIGLGPETGKFEKQFAEFIGSPYAIAVNSCTAALDLSLMLANIGPGDEVLIPTMTFVSTAHTVLYRGATPVFCDIDPHSLLIDFKSVQEKITNKTKAIIPVHYGGRCVDIDQLRNIVPNLTIIEDCAHACGSSLRGKMAGSLGDISCFSFHAVKNLAMGDGGMIIVNNLEHYNRVKKLRWLGIDKATWDRTQEDFSYIWEYNIEELGYKYHMNDIQASIGIVQLSKLKKMNAQRKIVEQTYREELSSCPEILLPQEDTDDSKSSWHIFQIQLDKRNEMITYLTEHQIATGVHYKPIHYYGCYGKQKSLLVAEDVWNKILSLPMHANLTKEQAIYITRVIKKYGL